MVHLLQLAKLQVRGDWLYRRHRFNLKFQLRISQFRNPDQGRSRSMALEKLGQGIYMHHANRNICL